MLDNLLKAYLNLALGRHVQYCVNLGQYGTFLLSGWTKGASWNHIIPKFGINELSEDTIISCEKIFASVNRPPSFYLFNTPEHLYFSKKIIQMGYQNTGRETWLLKNLSQDSAETPETKYRYSIVDREDLDDVKVFVSSFEKCFDYLPIGYSRQLYLSVISHDNVNDRHVYITSQRNHVVAVASIYFDTVYSGVFNFAVSPKYRKFGIGTLMMKLLEGISFGAGRYFTFVQSEESSVPFYLRLGYMVVSEAMLYQKR